MLQTIKQKLMLSNYQYDAVVVGDIPALPEGLERNKSKVEAAKEWLGAKYILHPANQIMRDAANDERQAFIKSVK